MTLEEMARELGISKSTVSRALSGKGRIGKSTREKVLQLAEKNGMFRANRSASADVAEKMPQRTGNLGVIMPADIYISGSAYFHECLLGICEAANMMDYDVMVTTSTENDISGIQDLVEHGKVDGIILTRSVERGKDLEYLSSIRFPTALTGTTNVSGIIQVDSDNKMASEMLTSILIGKGYRRFALFIEDMDFIVNRHRYGGFCDALSKNGLQKDKQYVYVGAGKIDVQDLDIGEMLAARVECIVCGDDAVCTRLMSFLQSQGYRIPRDIAVASMYNSPNLSCFTPSVTAINISARKMGVMAGRQMINFLNGKEYQHRTIVDYELLVRRSTVRMFSEREA